MSHRHISSRRPKADETLMSFLRGAQEDAGYSEDGFIALLAGSPMPDARLAERRAYDWDSLSRFFNATAQELYGLSERSDFYGFDDSHRTTRLRQNAPWLKTQGYSAHCPVCIRESSHWRRSWLRPDAVVCPAHGNVLVRHCGGCGGDLSKMRWRKTTPVCPECLMHLSFSPEIEAPRVLAYRAGVMSGEISALFKNGPLNRNDQLLASVATVWRASQLLATEPQFINICSTFCGCTDLGAYDTQRTVEGRSMRYAQSCVVAHFIAELNPSLIEHCWLAAGNAAGQEKADEAILLKLSEIADEVALQQTRTKAQGQLMMSFASCEGERTMPSAA